MTGPWRCTSCGKSFATARDARDHHRDQHARRLPHEATEAPFLSPRQAHDPAVAVSPPDVFPTTPPPTRPRTENR